MFYQAEIAADVFENIKDVGCFSSLTSVIGILTWYKRLFKNNLL